MIHFDIFFSSLNCFYKLNFIAMFLCTLWHQRNLPVFIFYLWKVSKGKLVYSLSDDEQKTTSSKPCPPKKQINIRHASYTLVNYSEAIAVDLPNALNTFEMQFFHIMLFCTNTSYGLVMIKLSYLSRNLCIDWHINWISTTSRVS